MAFLDLKKAFDQVPHKLFWRALRSHGPRRVCEVGQITVPQCHECGSMPSRNVIVGFHQGSALSPLENLVARTASNQKAVDRKEDQKSGGCIASPMTRTSTQRTSTTEPNGDNKAKRRALSQMCRSGVTPGPGQGTTAQCDLVVKSYGKWLFFLLTSEELDHKSRDLSLSIQCCMPSQMLPKVDVSTSLCLYRSHLIAFLFYVHILGQIGVKFCRMLIGPPGEGLNTLASHHTLT